MKKLLPFSFLVLLSFNICFAQDGFSVEDLNNNEFAELTYNNIKSTIIKEEFSSEILKQRLKELRDRTPFDVTYNTTIDRVIHLYLKTRKGDISNLMDKAKYYFPIFEEYLDKYDLPLEIKYLAIVESALEPNARSISGAKGLWQFMYNTGKQYDLNVNQYIDERTDPIRATQAACKYLKSLYNRFGNWDLALAAYNSGPGNVSKAIRKSGGNKNYWIIRKYLPTETRNYIPSFYATFYLFEYGNEHQIHPRNSEISFHETDTIHIKKKITFKEIQQRFNIDLKLLHFLNPQYKLGIIPFQENKKYYLTLPKSMIGKLESNESEVYKLAQNNIKKETLSFIIPNKSNSYIALNNDDLNSVAKKFNITTTQLKRWNGLQTNYLVEGQWLVIMNKKTKIQKIKATKNFNTYTVKEGDSLWRISKLFTNVTISQIKGWNNIWGISYLKPGTKLKILTN